MTSTHQTNSPPPRPADASAPSAKDSKLDLSMTQIVGGALAAMTAAALGSRLGVAGTITGAAVASVVAGVAGSLYTASLRHTREKVASALTNLRDGDARPVDEHQEPSGRPAALAVAGRRRRSGAPYKTIVAAAVATFAVALVALTGLESLAGSALSGGHGTTIEQVTSGKSKAQHNGDRKGSDTQSSDSQSSDTKGSDTASPSASSKPTSDPNATDSAPSDQPTSSSTESAPTKGSSTTGKASGSQHSPGNAG